MLFGSGPNYHQQHDISKTLLNCIEFRRQRSMIDRPIKKCPENKKLWPCMNYPTNEMTPSKKTFASFVAEPTPWSYIWSREFQTKNKKTKCYFSEFCDGFRVFSFQVWSKHQKLFFDNKSANWKQLAFLRKKEDAPQKNILDELTQVNG